MSTPRQGDDARGELDPTGVRALLSGLPDPGPMPEHLVARIHRSLEQEQAFRESGEPAPWETSSGDEDEHGAQPLAGATALDHTDDVISLAAERHRRSPTRTLGWLAGAAAVLLGTTIGVSQLLGSGTSGNSDLGAQYPASQERASADGEGGQAPPAAEAPAPQTNQDASPAPHSSVQGEQEAPGGASARPTGAAPGLTVRSGPVAPDLDSTDPSAAVRALSGWRTTQLSTDLSLETATQNSAALSQESATACTRSLGDAPYLSQAREAVVSPTRVDGVDAVLVLLLPQSATTTVSDGPATAWVLDASCTTGATEQPLLGPLSVE